jgi:divalent metal cation (Fe/Co/Zn/Cd) transporter
MVHANGGAGRKTLGGAGVAGVAPVELELVGRRSPERLPCSVVWVQNGCMVVHSPAADGYRDPLIRRGLRLEYATLAWNVVGCIVLLAAAVSARSIAFAGFGVDSVIEILASAVVVWQLKGIHESRSRTALLVISVGFALLAVYIAAQGIYTLSSSRHPGHSVLGVIWLALTVIAMLALAAGKQATGRNLGNQVLITESRVTVIDGLLAGAVLVGVLLNAAVGWWWADPISAFVIMLYAVRECVHAWVESTE